MSELTKEYFDEVIKQLATKEDVRNMRDEILLHLSEAMADIEEGLGPEERWAYFDNKLDRLEKILHIEV